MAPTLTLEDLARNSLVGFSGYCDPTWVAYPHVQLLAQKLEDVAYGRTRRLMFFLPPQHGKSQVASRFFPAWFLGRFPDKRLILTSYEASYAALWGRRARDLLTEFGANVFGVSLRRDSNAADHWEIEGRKGIMHTAGSGGPITGHGADVVVIDDPVKNREEAESETYRQRLVDWYRSVVITRLAKGGAIVLLMTRWHESDLAGWLLENEGERWEVVRLPAFAESGDPLGRKPGEALCPDLHPQHELEETRATQSSYEWAGMYDQRPTPAGGGLFKKAKAVRYRVEEPFFVLLSTGERISRNSLTRFVTVDTATSEDERNDFTAIGAWGVTTDRRLILMDAAIKRIEAPEIMQRITAMGLVHKTHEGPLVPWIEEQSTSKHLLSFLKREGLAFRSLKPDGDKFTRAIPASALLEHSRLILPETAPWLPEYERQLFSFPSGEHDDAVDMTSMAEHVMSTHMGDRLPNLAPFKPAVDPFAALAMRAGRDPFAGAALSAPRGQT